MLAVEDLSSWIHTRAVMMAVLESCGAVVMAASGNTWLLLVQIRGHWLSYE